MSYWVYWAENISFHIWMAGTWLQIHFLLNINPQLHMAGGSSSERQPGDANSYPHHGLFMWFYLMFKIDFVTFEFF